VNTALERYEDSKFDATKRKELVAELESCMQTKVFGNIDMGRVTQWSFRWDEGSRRMAKYNMSGVVVGKLMKRLHVIADTLFSSKFDEDPMSEADSQLIRSKNFRLKRSGPNYPRP
jgi:hypothetical protein